MGTDMISICERKENGKWIKLDVPEFFSNRNYSHYAFLAGVRNYDHCTPISKPKGWPDDSEYLNELQEPDLPSASQQTRLEEMEENGYWGISYLTLAELLAFDYEKTFWNRRISKPIYRADGSIGGHDGAALAEEGEGEIISYRDNLGEEFFADIERMKLLSDPENVRIVFWFC